MLAKNINFCNLCLGDGVRGATQRCLVFSDVPFPLKVTDSVIGMWLKPQRSWLDLSSLLYAPFQNFPSANVSQRSLL